MTLPVAESQVDSGTTAQIFPTRPVVESATLPVAESEVSTSTRPVAESATLPVAEPEVESAPTQLHTRIHWTAQWDLPTPLAESASNSTRQVAESEAPTRPVSEWSTREESTDVTQPAAESLTRQVAGSASTRFEQPEAPNSTWQVAESEAPTRPVSESPTQEESAVA